ncbi:MAG: fibronectin type III domain-containing protein, partial [bacterium]|nr:fibronectin type III domain-containing protein [bacterium]
NISATAISASSVKVTWTAINYTGDTGFYSIYYSTISGGPWTLAGTTGDKSDQTYTVTGLTTGTMYYFVVTTRTDVHLRNENIVVSGYSAEASATPQTPVVTYTLNVQSSPDTGAVITVTPNDNSSSGNGTTNFTRTYNSGTTVSLTAPSLYNGKDFSKWTVAGTDSSNSTVQVTMAGNKTATAYYVTPPTPPEISLSRDRMDFGYVMGGSVPAAQTFSVSNTGGGTLNWTASGDMAWLGVSPGSGSGSGVVTVSVDTTGLAAGTYTGAVSVSDPNASNLSDDVNVTLVIKEANQDQPPFGRFSTPLDGSTVSSSIPVTGWVLDDTGVESVKIYRDPVTAEGTGQIFIGDADFVEGVRPDVEQAYPEYPMNYRAGWGYMLLTNFLPEGGNGTFKLTAIATDGNGNTATLGTKTVTCDNANAVKPFGAIDTPDQGGTASGAAFINWGWVLTPQPNAIPTDGSTIDVIVDGVKTGNPTYNIFRSDIANLFPGYANSDGAVGYFYLDTTAYENGVHTIQWTASDNAGNSDGIGSRYFTIMNNGGARGQRSAKQFEPIPGDINQLPNLTLTPIKVIRGFERDSRGRELLPGKSGIFRFTIRELERVEIGLSNHQDVIRGYTKVNGQFRALPIGSTFDRLARTFYWSPGAGFTGSYTFVFISKSPTGTYGKQSIEITILPKQQ